jgi:hypothetical protein
MKTAGSCLCGGYSFEVDGEFSEMADCFCSMCRKAHGAAYATFVGCEAAGFNLMQGEELVCQYQSSEQGVRAFCKTCGSNLPMIGEDQVYIPAGMLDADPVVRTSAHLFASSRAPWVEIHDDAPQFDGYPE